MNDHDFQQLSRQDPDVLCMCEDPISAHSDHGSHACELWNCRCLCFALKQEFKEPEVA